jgi:catechol 2,3-dioxygenase-like lactoylglutathione lyase family enzyme
MSSLRSVRLLVTDFEASYRFYADSMQLPVLYGDQNGPYAEFGDESGISLAIFQKTLMLDMLRDEGGEAKPTDDFMLEFKARGTVDEDSAALGVHATKIIAPTDRDAWGVRAAHFRDPQGFLVEVNKSFDE